MTMELKVINSFMFYNRYTPAVKYLPFFHARKEGLCEENRKSIVDGVSGCFGDMWKISLGLLTGFL